MKKLVFLLIAVLAFSSLKAQTLTIPVSYARTSPISDSITKNWAGQLIPIDDNTESVVTYKITTSWKPENIILNTMVQNGCNTSNWPLYFRANDSTFFEAVVSDIVGVKSRTIEGRYTTNFLKWKNFLEVGHELYWNSFNGNFIILATKDNGTFMTLSEVITIRNDYTQVNGFYTIPGLAELTQTNLWQRTGYDTWIQKGE